MRRLPVLIAACSVIALATAAQANPTIDSVDPLATSSTRLGDHGTVDHGTIGTPAGTQDLTDGDRSLRYSSTYNITSSEISFQSGGIGIGDQTTTSSTSRIDMLITNHSDGQLNATMHSQITAAGMGMYLGDNSAGNCFSAPASCAQIQGGHTFQDLTQVSGANTIALVTVDFQIVQDNTTLLDLSGGLRMTQDGRVFLNSDVTGLQSFPLDHFLTQDQFGIINPNSHVSDSALGFSWDATDFSVDLNSINSSDTSQISYIVTVTTSNTASCFADGTCLVTYAGFGDPIGRGGGISSAALLFGGDSFGVFNNDGSGPQFINGVNFSPETFALPSFDSNGDLVLQPPGAPEPSTWALSIMGFGLLGAALRRRRVLAYAG